ncbi:hypothetical protein, partial [Curtobacterium flaccumfaciens]|uniref:hypothetical protein n=2 Tax=Curtobacterium flaccumfaciens TaxID=2035 RepID=UPI0005ABE10E
VLKDQTHSPLDPQKDSAREAFVLYNTRAHDQKVMDPRAGCLSGTPSGLHLQVFNPVIVSAVPFSASAATSDYFTQR